MAGLKAALETLGMLLDLALKLGAAVLVVWVLSLSQKVICDGGASSGDDGVIDRIVDFVRDLPVASGYFERRRGRCEDIARFEAFQENIAALDAALKDKTQEAEALRASLETVKADLAEADPATGGGTGPAIGPATAGAGQPQTAVETTRDAAAAAQRTVDSALDAKRVDPAFVAALRERADDALRSASGRLDQLYAQVEMPSAPLAPRLWAVIAGADRDMEGALHEARSLRRAGAEKVEILLLDGWLRTAALYETREAARGAQPALDAALGRTTLLRALPDFCPGATAGERDGEAVVLCD